LGGWIIDVDKKYNFKNKLLAKQDYIKVIKDIFMVDERIEEYLEKNKNNQIQ